MKQLVVLTVLAFAACDKPRTDEEAAPTRASGVVASFTAPATATAAPTSSIRAESKWPSYLPDYPGAKITNKSPDMMSLETSDPPEKVIAFYKEKLLAAGFPPGRWASLAANGGQPTVMTASKGSDMVQVTVIPAQGTTKITVATL